MADTPVEDVFNGRIVYEDEHAVVRVRRVGEELRVFAHRRGSHGGEELPRGYVLGSNMMIYGGKQ